MMNVYEMEVKNYFAKIRAARDEELRRMLSTPRTREEWLGLLDEDEDENANTVA